MTDTYQITAIGRVKKDSDRTWIEIDEQYRDALKGLDGFSHINVLFWFHENDTQDKRSILQVHPRKDPKKPLTGVFATHSPVRPNLIGLTRCEILAVQGTVITIKEIDALNDSPVIDIKCYIPDNRDNKDAQVPEWV